MCHSPFGSMTTPGLQLKSSCAVSLVPSMTIRSFVQLDTPSGLSLRQMRSRSTGDAVFWQRNWIYFPPDLMTQLSYTDPHCPTRLISTGANGAAGVACAVGVAVGVSVAVGAGVGVAVGTCVGVLVGATVAAGGGTTVVVDGPPPHESSGSAAAQAMRDVAVRDLPPPFTEPNRFTRVCASRMRAATRFFFITSLPLSVLLPSAPRPARTTCLS